MASITDAQSNATTFTYDGRGNRLTSVDALNNTTSYTYDAMNRLTKITAPDHDLHAVWLTTIADGALP